VNPPVARLCVALGYTFGQPELLEEALTHRSASARNNERLEFLGDALLNLIVAEYLFQHYPKASEGDLTRFRASLVRRETLVELACGLNLGDGLRLGQGQVKSDRFPRESILANAMEAVVGAVYLDGGFAACRDLIVRLYQTRFERLTSAEELKDPKTRLQEYLHARQQPLPAYNVLEIRGKPHAQSFMVECVAAESRAVATGSSRRKAEQEAARRVLEQIQ
jgi:ribonuclease-3